MQTIHNRLDKKLIRRGKSEREFFTTPSTTFTQCTREATEFGETTQIRPITPFNVIQCHGFWYQSKAHIRLLIND